MILLQSVRKTSSNLKIVRLQHKCESNAQKAKKIWGSFILLSRYPEVPFSEVTRNINYCYGP